MSVSVDEVIRALRSKKNVLLYGPPGTGKTHLMNAVARRMVSDAAAVAAGTTIVVNTDSESTPLEEQGASSIVKRWVTFHQGYSYEDFVLGMRPESESDALLSLTPKAGVLLELAAEVLDGADEGLLLIDEINRGNASRIFGEFITLLEDDKRLASDGSETETTIPVSLPYLSAEETFEITTAGGVYEQGSTFLMPSKVYTLASMNSVDKSVAPLDTALRRRFHIINLVPGFADLRAAVGLQETDSVRLVPVSSMAARDDVARVAVRVFEKLNRGIGLYLGSEFCLGQWYLARLANSRLDFDQSVALLVDIWNFSVMPQLVELFHGRTEQFVALLEIDRMDTYRGLNVTTPEGDELEIGAMPFVEASAGDVDSVFSYLAQFAGAPAELSVTSDSPTTAQAE